MSWSNEPWGRVRAAVSPLAADAPVDRVTDAEIEPVVRRPRWLSKQEFMNGVLAHQADAALTGELTALLLDHPRADPT